jgi:hypothetical protein
MHSYPYSNEYVVMRKIYTVMSVDLCSSVVEQRKIPGSRVLKLKFAIFSLQLVA